LKQFPRYTSGLPEAGNKAIVIFNSSLLLCSRNRRGRESGCRGDERRGWSRAGW